MNENVLTYSNAGLTAPPTATLMPRLRKRRDGQARFDQGPDEVPLIQGMLRYAYKTSLSMGLGRRHRRGLGVLRFGILGMINNCDPTASATVITNMQVNAASPMADGYDAVRDGGRVDVHLPRRGRAPHRRPRRQLRARARPRRLTSSTLHRTTTAGSIAKQGLVVSVAVVSALGAMLMAL